MSDEFGSLSSELAAVRSAGSPVTRETISRFEFLLTALASDRTSPPAVDSKRFEAARYVEGRSLYDLMSPPATTESEYLRELIGELFQHSEQADILSDSAIYKLLGRARAIKEAKDELAQREAEHARSIKALAKVTEDLEGRERAILYRVIMQRDYIDMESRCEALTTECKDLRNKFSKISSLVSEFRYQLDYVVKRLHEADEEGDFLRSLMGYLTKAPGMPTSYYAIYEDKRTTKERMVAMTSGGVDMSSSQLLYEICSAWLRSAARHDRRAAFVSGVLDAIDGFLIGNDYQAGLYSLIGSPSRHGIRPRVPFLDWSKWVAKEHPPGGWP